MLITILPVLKPILIFTKNDGHGDFNNYNVSADYKKKFNTKGHEITADAFYYYSG